AALGLVQPPPAAGPRILAGLHLRRAGLAAERGIALGDEGMRRQVVLGHIGLQLVDRPGGERIDLDAGAVLLEGLDRRARRRLETLAPGEPGVEALHGARQRLGLADPAAG